jgi:hypothetical protein
MTPVRMAAVIVAALAAGAAVVAIELASDHREAKTVWAIFGPAVGWSFIGTGLYAWRRRPESGTGALMVLADDGVGGADAARGSGLRGLADRVAALDGTISLDSPPGRGTRLRAELPCDGSRP